MALTYTNYLKIDELLDLQKPLSDGPEHDETLFIIIHQVYELWFKQMLHEMSALGPALERGDRPMVVRTFKRVLTILKVAVSQVDILETMSPLSFNSFRTRLESSSGFQSIQFRELEFFLGHRSPERLKTLPAETQARLTPYLTQPSLWDYLLRYLKNEGHPIPQISLDRPLSAPLQEDPALQKVFVQIYKNDPLSADICERMLDLDEGLQEWRYRHVKMVERQIGSKMGTGGSPGTQYLIQTLFKPLFPDLWAIRSQF